MDIETRKRLDRDATMRSVYNLRVFVVGGGFQYLQMFFEAGFLGAQTVKDADVVCFTGGEDINPALYGEEPIRGIYFNTIRDDGEVFIYKECLALKKPMVGICRGSQFLNALNEGKLWQDVNNHCGSHSVKNLKTGKTIQGMTSTHHQQMIPGPGADVLAVAALSTQKQNAAGIVKRTKPDFDDTEAVWYPDTMSLCFQPHPEFAHGQCRDYFLELLDEYVLPAC